MRQQARRASGGRLLAVTAVSASLAGSERDDAARFARSIGVEHRWEESGELSNPDYARNDPLRCYHCKTELFRITRTLMEKGGYGFVAYGFNASDRSDIRPGHRAALENAVISPLADAELTKEEIRALMRCFELDLADKPAGPCLSSKAHDGCTGHPGEALVRSILLECAVVVAILAVVAGWRFTPPPRALAAAAPLAIHIHTDKAMFQVLVSPGEAGTDSFVLQLMQGDGSPLAAKQATLTLSLPERGIEPMERQAVRRRADGSPGRFATCPFPSWPLASADRRPGDRLRADNAAGRFRRGGAPDRPVRFFQIFGLRPDRALISLSKSPAKLQEIHGFSGFRDPALVFWHPIPVSLPVFPCPTDSLSVPMRLSRFFLPILKERAWTAANSPPRRNCCAT